MNVIFKQSQNNNSFTNIQECNIDHVSASLTKYLTAEYWQVQIKHKQNYEYMSHIQQNIIFYKHSQKPKD